MFYEFLGRLVWKGLKAFLRLKYGRLYMPKSVAAGATVAVGVGVLVAAQRAADRDSS